MTVTINPLGEREFFAWYNLFTEYAASAGVQPDDNNTMRVWTSLQSPTAYGALALEGGDVVGFAHSTEFERLLQGDRGYTVEDLFVTERARGRGVATALIEHIRTRAEQHQRAAVRWVSTPDDPAARALAAKFSSSASDWLLHEAPVA